MAAPRTAVEQPPAEAAAPRLRPVEDRLGAIESDVRHAATRADLEAVKAKLTVLQSELKAVQDKLDAMQARLDGMATKADLAMLEAKMEGKFSNQLRWIVGSVFAATSAIIFSIVRFMG